MLVGIPRALLYYQYYPMWKTFLETVGASVLVSAPTTKATLAAGSERVIAETCMPVKVYCGHVLALADYVDWVLVPAVRSLEPKVYSCPKFLGLPDLVRAVLPEVPPLLQPEIDLDRKWSRDGWGSAADPSRIPLEAWLALSQTILRVGSVFTRDPRQIKAAADRAWEVHQDYLCLMQTGLTPPEAIALWERSGGAGEISRDAGPAADALTVALVGHPYDLYDDYVTHKLVPRLRGLGVKLVTPEMASPEALRQGIIDLTGQPYWTYEGELVGAAGHYLRDEGVDGLIAVVSFGCGPDSGALDVVRRAAHQARRPFMALVMDEHAGEAGLITRLEAFVDMLERWRRVDLCGGEVDSGGQGGRLSGH